MLEGDLPKRALKFVQEWLKEYPPELLKIWETQELIQLPPLE